MKIRELYASEDRWTKFVMALTKERVSTGLDDNNAHAFCLLGAVRKCYEGERAKEVLTLLTRNLPSTNYGGFFDIITSWNDSDERKFEEVKALVDKLDI